MIAVGYGFMAMNPGSVIEEKGEKGCISDGYEKGTEEFEKCMQNKGMRFQKTKREALENLGKTQELMEQRKGALKAIQGQ